MADADAEKKEREDAKQAAWEAKKYELDAPIRKAQRKLEKTEKEIAATKERTKEIREKREKMKEIE